uniref:Uncharacterized protein n=1 Tax=viral metagenome TaxID=1070528 RepID=A0A6M3JV58_9ZZZZ
MPDKKINLDFSTYSKTPPPNTTADVPIIDNNLGTTDASKKDPFAITAEIVDDTPFDQFDLAKIQTVGSFLAIKEKLGIMREKAKQLVVKDEASNTLAMEMRVQIKALLKSIDDAKDAYPPYKTASEFKNGADRFLREQYRKPLEEIDTKLVAPKINSYQKAQAEINRRIAAKKAEEDAKIAREEAEKKATEEKERQEKERQDAIALQAKLNLEADESGVERVSVHIPEVTVSDILPSMPETPVTPKTEKVITDHGSSKIESSWICIIIDANQVPRNFCVPDQKLLNAAIDAGVREIPGCKIEEIFESKVRLSRKRVQNDIVF